MNTSPDAPSSEPPKSPPDAPSFLRRIGENVLSNLIWWILGLVVLAVLSVAGIHIGQSGGGSPTTTTTLPGAGATHAPSASSASAVEHSIGSTLKDGAFLVTLSAPATCTPDTQSTTAGTVLTSESCTWTLKIRNESNKADSYYAGYDAYVYIGSEQYPAYALSGLSDEIFPFTNGSMTIAFDLPIGAEPDKLSVDGGGAYWNLNG